jgi:hypothetical protein
MMETVFHTGDKVICTAEHLICNGQTGTVVKWYHDNIYEVRFDNGHNGAIFSNEMEVLA